MTEEEYLLFLRKVRRDIRKNQDRLNDEFCRWMGFPGHQWRIWRVQDQTMLYDEKMASLAAQANKAIESMRSFSRAFDTLGVIDTTTKGD